MAANTDLRSRVSRVGSALRSFARKRGLKGGTYKIHYRVDPCWGFMHFALVAQDFTRADQSRNCAEIRKYLDETLADDNDLLTHLSLIVRTPEQVSEGGLYAIGPEYREFRAKKSLHQDG